MQTITRVSRWDSIIVKAGICFKQFTVTFVVDLEQPNLSANRLACFAGVGFIAHGLRAKPLCKIAL